MTMTGQNFTSYVGLERTQTWRIEDEDHSAETPTFAVRAGAEDFTIAGTAALDGADTVFTVVIPADIADTQTLGPGHRPYQPHVTNFETPAAEGTWTLRDNYAD